MSGHRPVRLPPPELEHWEIPVMDCVGQTYYRVHDQTKGAVHFSLNEGHRYSHPACPFAVLYLAEKLETCLWERFGDELMSPSVMVSRGLWMSRAISRVTVGPLRVCDSTSALTRAALRVDLGALHHPELSIPQAWGLALQRHPLGFDGIRYASRFDQEPCLAVFGRSEIVGGIRCDRVGALGELPEGDAFLLKHRVALV